MENITGEHYFWFLKAIFLTNLLRFTLLTIGIAGWAICHALLLRMPTRNSSLSEAADARFEAHAFTLGLTVPRNTKLQRDLALN